MEAGSRLLVKLFARSHIDVDHPPETPPLDPSGEALENGPALVCDPIEMVIIEKQQVRLIINPRANTNE